jgi:[ribosomal protein S5]-alanine N-acetyltransferase
MHRTHKALPQPSAEPPELRTARLLLRPLRMSDAAEIARIGGQRAIADTTISVPHPLDEAGARDWIRDHLAVPLHEQIPYVATLPAGGPLLGFVALKHIEAEHRQAELSFWFDPAMWGKGYAREAAARVVEYAFNDAGIRRLVAYYMVRNPASGRLLDSLGFFQEGLFRERVIKWGVLEDVIAAALLAPRPPRAAV